MLTFHRFALTLLLTAGPFRVACHASVSHPSEGKTEQVEQTGQPGQTGQTQQPSEVCSRGEADDEPCHSRTTRSPSTRQVSHLHARANESSWVTTTSAPG